MLKHLNRIKENVLLFGLFVVLVIALPFLYMIGLCSKEDEEYNSCDHWDDESFY